MAMVTDVHLVTLKKYESTFLRFASARFDHSSGLRPPNAWSASKRTVAFGSPYPSFACKAGLWTIVFMRTRLCVVSWHLFWLLVFSFPRLYAARRAREREMARAMAQEPLATAVGVTKAREKAKVVGVALAPVVGEPVWATKATPAWAPQAVSASDRVQKPIVPL